MAPALATPGQTNAHLLIAQDPANAGNGLELRRDTVLPQSLLNQDSGVLDDNDEIYAQASFVDPDCKARLATTQVITNLFSSAGEYLLVPARTVAG